MRYIDIHALLKTIRSDVDGEEACAALARAHRSLAIRFAHDRQGYIKRNGAAKWRPLKERLTELLGKKCWYTEAEPTGGDLVIDHYRPKSVYWFLAFDEHNYRVACPYANTSHHNEEHGRAGGKGEHFPLLDGSNRARGRNQVKMERPVILDPCNEEDCKLISFLPDGRPVIHPDFVNAPFRKKRVEESKILLNLDHPDFNSKRALLHESDPGDLVVG